MPIHEYICTCCHLGDTRIAGFDDHEATCHRCGGLMLRISDPFAPPEVVKVEVAPCAKS